MANQYGQQEVIEGVIACIAGGTIAKGKLVMPGGSNDVVVTTAITSLAIGVALQSVTSGQAVPVQTRGVALCIAGGTIADGDEVMPKTTASTGEIEAAAGATARSVGVALGNAASGESVAVLLATPAVKRPPNS